jgi:predicted transcriptional regulator
MTNQNNNGEHKKRTKYDIINDILELTTSETTITDIIKRGNFTKSEASEYINSILLPRGLVIRLEEERNVKYRRTPEGANFCEHHREMMGSLEVDPFFNSEPLSESEISAIKLQLALNFINQKKNGEKNSRTHQDFYAFIIGAVIKGLTRDYDLQTAANINYQQYRTCIGRLLSSRSLVKRSNGTIAVTSKGVKCLEHYIPMARSVEPEYPVNNPAMRLNFTSKGPNFYVRSRGYG